MAFFLSFSLQTVSPISSLLASGATSAATSATDDLNSNIIAPNFSTLSVALPILQHRPFLILAISLLLLAVALPVSAGRPALLLR